MLVRMLLMLSNLFATTFYSYTILPLIKPDQTSSKHRSARPAFLYMSGFVVVEAGQEVILECRAENLERQFTVGKFLIMSIYCQEVYREELPCIPCYEYTK
jgi:hypothetical protein